LHPGQSGESRGKEYHLVDERIPPFRNRIGKKRSPSPWILAFIFLFFMGALFAIFLRSPLSKIKEIEISGNQLVSTETILKKARLQKGVSFFGVQPGEIANQIRTIPEVRHAEVKKSFPDKVTILVREKPVVGWVETKDQKHLPILSDGTILPHRQLSFKYDRILFKGWDLAHPMLQQTVQEIGKIPPMIQRSIKEVRPVPKHQDQVEILTGYQHRIFVRVEDLAQKMNYYPSFSKHPQGTLYLLESIWFIPDDGTEPAT
jgi:cell division protein FtsQ